MDDDEEEKRKFENRESRRGGGEPQLTGSGCGCLRVVMRRGCKKSANEAMR